MNRLALLAAPPALAIAVAGIGAAHGGDWTLWTTVWAVGLTAVLDHAFRVVGDITTLRATKAPVNRPSVALASDAAVDLRELTQDVKHLAGTVAGILGRAVDEAADSQLPADVLKAAAAQVDAEFTAILGPRPEPTADDGYVL